MSNLLYNGVSLPTIPAHDASYGVEVIVKVLPSGQSIYGGAEYILAIGKRTLWQNGKCYVSGIYAVYRLSGDAWVWHYGAGTVSTQDIVAANYFEALWTNTNIPTADGSGIYLAATAPVDPNAPDEPDEPVEPDEPEEPETPTVTKTELRRAFFNGFILGMQMRGMLKKRVVEEPDEPVAPDAPAADFYLYGRPSESGNIAIAEGDGYVLYSGAVLPKLPKTGYKYALLGESLSNRPYEVALSNRPMRESSLMHAYASGSEGVVYLFNEESGEWVYPNTWSPTDGLMSMPKIPAIWANFDVMNSDGTAVSVPASTPVPLASTEPVAVMYGGETLPPIDTVFTDEQKAQYPYLTIVGSNQSWSAVNSMYRTKSPMVWKTNRLTVANNDAIVSRRKTKDDPWGAVEASTLNSVTGFLVWADYDILNEDGTPYFTTSGPVSIYEKKE